MRSNDQASIQSQLDEMQHHLDQEEFGQVRRLLSKQSAPDLAHIIESSPPRMRNALWEHVENQNQGEVLQYFSDEVQADFLGGMDSEHVASITEGLAADDVADILQQMPEEAAADVLDSMDIQARLRVERVLAYDEDTAGGLMNTDTLSVRPNIAIDVVLRFLRRHTELPETTDKVFVVSRDDEFIGELPLSKILVSDPSSTVREVMRTDVEAIRADMDASKVAKLFERHDWISAAVVNEQGLLLGRITIDDVVDVIRDDADHSLMSMAGLDEDSDTFAPTIKTAKRRAVWLGINLLTALAASAVIGLFQDTLDKVVALAVLMPIVASMGGVAGTQTLTVVVRGMALGQIGRHNSGWLVNREVLSGLLNGMLWAIVVGMVAMVWFDDSAIGYIIAAAMVINLIAASLAGAVLPIILKTLKVDPALAGGVALTTVTDIVGFMSFLGLATWFYL